VIGTEVYDVGPLSVSFIVRKYLSKDAEAFWRVFRKTGNSRVSAVPLVTRYRMEGLGFEPPWRQVFHLLHIQFSRSYPGSCVMVTEALTRE